MNAKKISLKFDDTDKKKRGYVIQNLQKSKAFEGHSIKDFLIQSINPNKDRGYHSHREKTEWFMALSGEAKLVTSEKMNPDNLDLEIETLKADCLKPTHVLLIRPNLTHWIINYSKEAFIMASFSSKEYSPAENVQYDDKIWRPITDQYVKRSKKSQHE